MLSKEWLAAAGVALKDLILAHVAAALADVDVEIFGQELHPFAFMQTWANDLVAEANTALANANAAQTTANTAQSTATTAQSTATTAQSTATTAQSAATTAQSTATTAQSTATTAQAAADTAQSAANAAQIQLQAIQGAANAAPGSGTVIVLPFSGANGDNVSASDWSGTDLVIRGNKGYLGIPAGYADGYYSIRTIGQFTADDQSASTVLGDNGNLGQTTTICLRCNSGYTAGAGLHITAGGLQVVYFTRSGSSWTFTPIGSAWSRTQRAGELVELRAIGNTYWVYINGVLLGSRTDSPSHVSTGASYRYGMIVQQRSTIGFQQDDSFRLASFTLSDAATPAIAGTGFHLGRSSTSSVTPTGGGAQFSGVFDTNVATSQGITIQSLGAGEVIIPKSGFWSLYCSVVANGTVTTFGTQTFKIGFKVWSSSAKTGTPVYFHHGIPLVAPSGNFGDGGLAVIFNDYLQAGWCVAPVWVSSPVFAIKGNSDGATTMFSGHLASPS